LLSAHSRPPMCGIAIAPPLHWHGYCYIFYLDPPTTAVNVMIPLINAHRPGVNFFKLDQISTSYNYFPRKIKKMLDRVLLVCYNVSHRA
jgi:hypothetical protein